MARQSAESKRHHRALKADERMRRQVQKAKRRDGIGEVMRGAIRRGGQSNMVELELGFTITQLREHLEAQFRDGMSWDAFMRSEIHIDHVIPQAAFDLSDPEQWRACWALTNLQPLWATDNLSKGARLPCGAIARRRACG